MSKNKRRQIGTVTAVTPDDMRAVERGRVARELEQAEQDERAGLIPSAHEGGDPMPEDFGGTDAELEQAGAFSTDAGGPDHAVRPRPTEIARTEGSGAGYSATFLSGSVAHLDSGGAYAGEMGQLSRERQAFVDQAAIARFGAGYPAAGCYREATKLWDERAKWLREQERKR